MKIVRFTTDDGREFELVKGLCIECDVGPICSESCNKAPYDGCENDKCWRDVKREELDLSRCPLCGGSADNGFDRQDPPNPYVCTKCEVRK